MKPEDTGVLMLTKEEFCKKVKIDPSNHIFKDEGENPRFYMYSAVKNRVVDEPEKYFYNNGIVLREFKHMFEYEETWIRKFDMTVKNPRWSL